MMNKACLALIVALFPAALFAGDTLVTRTTQTTRTTSRCDFRVDKCETSVAKDPSYIRFKDGRTPLALAGSLSGSGDATSYQSSFGFVDYASPSQQLTIEELVALIRSKLSNCPEVTVKYNDDSGDITVHYLKGTCECCDYVVNVRNVKADDFVWVKTSDNYSPYLGQMERLKFHTTSEEDAQKIYSACQQICKINNWPTYK